jgi:hypothetical protein
MEATYVSWAMVLIGLGAATAGGVGLFLPPGHRLTALLPLVIGAGIGLAALFAQIVDVGPRPEDPARAFLIASTLGFVTVVATLVVLIRRVRAS